MTSPFRGSSVAWAPDPPTQLGYATHAGGYGWCLAVGEIAQSRTPLSRCPFVEPSRTGPRITARSGRACAHEFGIPNRLCQRGQPSQITCGPRNGKRLRQRTQALPNGKGILRTLGLRTGIAGSGLKDSSVGLTRPVIWHRARAVLSKAGSVMQHSERPDQTVTGPLAVLNCWRGCPGRRVPRRRHRWGYRHSSRADRSARDPSPQAA